MKISVIVIPHLDDDALNRLGMTRLGDRVLLRAEAQTRISREDPRDIIKSQGRPACQVNLNDLNDMQLVHLTTCQITHFCDVSESTVKKTQARNKMRQEDYFFDITVNYSGNMHDFPYWGEKMIRGHLLLKGLRVQRLRLRELLHLTDPIGVDTRRRRALKRRVYSVNGPRALWHMVGAEKLKRWHFYIQGCIDGYSPVIVYLKVANNKRAETVKSFFTTAVDKWGLPLRVRMDMGGENTGVATYMLNHPQRGPGRGSCLVGQSVHQFNQ